MNLKIYAYQNCDTCRKAFKFLDACGAKYTTTPIREQPPTRAELKRMLRHCGRVVRKLFNTSGKDYNKLKLKDKLPKMGEDEAIELLANNGNLVKRPFLLTPDAGLLGFNEVEWKNLLK
jgi:Spx/MgsR family transcriptional regulator